MTKGREKQARDLEAMPDWERLLAAERHLQHVLPGTVLVGGTAAALHACHRLSHDGVHVLDDLRSRFDEVLETLESVAGWETRRIRRPVVILRRLEGIETGIRQLRRTQPLETEQIEGLRVPTLGEMARIKAWLLITRYTVRDYLDTVVLFERLGEEGVRSALSSFDRLYEQPTGASPLVEIGQRLAEATPTDRPEVDLRTYRGLAPPWNDWQYLSDHGRRWAETVSHLLLGRPPEESR